MPEFSVDSRGHAISPGRPPSRGRNDQDRAGTVSQSGVDHRGSGPVVGGRYRLQEELGRGAMARVWRAWDVLLDRTAAVKVLDPAWRADPVAVERLSREARSVARLAHQNIVRLYDFDVNGDVAYLAMELVEGHSLADVLTVSGRLPVWRAVAIARQICDALTAVHADGVVHRDIKPSNILVGRTGMVKVCDFGIVRMGKAAGQAAITGTDIVVGTCHFMAPEQARGGRVDARTDLYAVGCVLYAMLTGAPPFSAENPMDLLDLHLNEPPVPLRAHRDDIPPDLDWLVRDLLAKRRADRPATARSVRDRLRTIGGESVPVPAGTDPPTVPIRTGGFGGSGDPCTVSPPAPTSDGPATPASDGSDGAGGRHRAAPVAATVLAFARRWISGWVVVLAAGAVFTTVLTASTLSGGGRPDAPAGQPPPSSVAAPPPHTGSILTGEPTYSPEPTRPAAGTAAPSRHVAPLDQIASLAAILRQQRDAGQLESKATRELSRKLAEVTRRLNAGEITRAAESFAEFRDRLAQVRRDGSLTTAGSDALPDLDQTAEALDP